MAAIKPKPNEPRESRLSEYKELIRSDELEKTENELYEIVSRIEDIGDVLKTSSDCAGEVAEADPTAAWKLHFFAENVQWCVDRLVDGVAVIKTGAIYTHQNYIENEYDRTQKAQKAAKHHRAAA